MGDQAFAEFDKQNYNVSLSVNNSTLAMRSYRLRVYTFYK